jgi:TP901 family phage tail tape measure protein
VADTERFVKIIFGGVDQTGTAFKSVGSNLQGLEHSIGSLTQPMASITGGILKMDAALIALGATFVGFSTNEAGKFADATNEIYTLISATPAEFERFKGDILDYSRESVQSIEEINGAVYSAVSAGVKYTEALDLLRVSEKLAVAGKADLNATTVVLASTLNAYGEGVDKARAYSDALFTTVKLGQTTLPELAQSLAQVTGIASSSGVPFETLTAAIADLTAKGLPTAQAVTGIKAALSNIIKPSVKAMEAAKELGVQFDVAALQSKGFEGLLQDVAKATGGNTDQMARFFGSVEGLNAVLALTKNAGQDFIDKLEQMRKAAGATEDAYGKMSNNFALINQNIANNVKATLVEVGERLLDEYGDIAKSVSSLFTQVGKGIDAGAFDPLFNMLERAAAEIAVTIAEVAKNLPDALNAIDWTEFEKAAQGLADAFGDLFSDTDLTTPEGLADAIQKVVDAGEKFISINEGIVRGIEPFIQQLGELVKWFSEIDTETFKTGGMILGIGAAINLTLPILGLFGKAISAFGDGLKWLGGSSVVGGVSKLSGVLASMGGLSGALGATGVAGAVGMASYELGRWLDLNDLLIPGVDTLGTKLYDLLNPTNDFTTSVTVSADRLAELRSQAANTAGGMSELGEASKTAGAAQVDLIDSQGELEDIMSGVTELLGKQVTGFEDVTAAATDAGDKTAELKGNAAGYFEAIDRGNNVVELFAKKQAKTADATKKTAKEMAEAEEKAQKFRLEMEKLASEERIKLIEAQVKLNIAGLESDTKKFEAIFDSIDSTITSTGNLIGSLFGNLLEADSWSQIRAVEEQIDLENKRRQEALDIQKKLSEAEIALLQRKAEALAKGDALIKIEADGLEPEIEAFMWRILEKIQLRANADSEEFLLNVAEAV